MSDQPYIRTEPVDICKILRIRAELAAGTYQVSPEDLAVSLQRYAEEQKLREIHRAERY